MSIKKSWHYILKDAQGQLIKGGFRENEFQRTKYADVYLIEKVLKKRSNKEHVKWVGFDQSYNSWVDI